MQQVAVRCRSKNIKWNRSMVGVVSFALMIDRTNVLFEGYVRLRQFLGRAALRLGQARGPGAVATSVTDQLTLVQKYVSSIGH